jgi:tetratricopeptide (TPR) repeat protein
MDNHQIESRSKELNSVDSILLGKDPIDTSSDGTELVSEEQRRSQGQAMYRMAKVYYDKADFKKAESELLKALDLCEIPQDIFAMMKICGFLIRIYSEGFKREQAQEYINMSLMLLEVTSDSMPSLGAEFFFYQGVTETYLGKFEEARKHFHFAYKKAQESNEPELVAKSLLSLAQNYHQSKDYKSSLKVLDQLSQLLTILNKGYLKGSMFLLYGQVYNMIGDSEKAIENFKKASKEFNTKLCWNLAGYVMLGMGRSYKKLGEYKLALVYFESAKDLTHGEYFKRLIEKIDAEISDVNNANIDFIIDKQNRMIFEKELGTIDFKHRFVLLEILFLLAKNPGKFFDKEDLSRDIWKEEYNPLIHDKLIYTSISRLRKLIEPKDDEKNRYILRGKDGYTFNPNVNVRFYQNSASDLDSVSNVEISAPV